MSNRYTRVAIVIGIVLLIVIVALYLNSGTRTSRQEYCDDNLLAFTEFQIGNAINSEPEFSDPYWCDEFYKRNHITLPWLPG